MEQRRPGIGTTRDGILCWASSSELTVNIPNRQHLIRTQETHIMSHVTGRCLCGGIRFRVRLPTLWCVHCHCSMCRTTHGAAFVTWFGVPEEAFALTSNDDNLEWHQSSPEAKRGFCNRCGTSLLFKSSRWEGELHVTLANVQQPIDQSPSAHVYYDTHVDWIQLTDDLPRFDDAPSV